MDNSVYNGINQCRFTMLEALAHKADYPDGTIIRCFKDEKGQLRIVAFKSAAHKVGYSGVLVHPWGEIRYKETCRAMRRQGATRALCAMLTVWGERWYPSQDQTLAGAACYQRPTNGSRQPQATL